MFKALLSLLFFSQCFRGSVVNFILAWTFSVGCVIVVAIMRRRSLAVAICLFCLAARSRADSVVVFNEIMYHPQTNEPALEWLELHNEMGVDIDLSGWSLGEGIEFRFAEGTVIPGGGYLVVAIDPAALTAGTGLANVLGPFTGRLSNAGEQLELRNNNNRVMDSITYGVEGDWPAAPDGSGVSLAKRWRFAASGNANNWSMSAQVGGTPGRENFPQAPPPMIETTVIATEGTWKFDDRGTDLGTAWREPGFNDSAWPSGAGLFFQEDGPLPAAKNTPLTPGRSTYYFRTRFTFNGD